MEMIKCKRTWRSQRHPPYGMRVNPFGFTFTSFGSKLHPPTKSHLWTHTTGPCPASPLANKPMVSGDHRSHEASEATEATDVRPMPMLSFVLGFFSVLGRAARGGPAPGGGGGGVVEMHLVHLIGCRWMWSFWCPKP